MLSQDHDDDTVLEPEIQTTNGDVEKPVSLNRSAVSMNGTQSNGVNYRRFMSNPGNKGVMQKFIKSRGKMSAINTIKNPISPPSIGTFNVPDDIEPPKVFEPGKCVRKGYVPVMERMRKEIEDYQAREMELRLQRVNSHSELNHIDAYEMSDHEDTLRPTKSMGQLYGSEEYLDDSYSTPAIKEARSLAELCDVSEDELDVPGSHSLIEQWEMRIQSNQRTNM